MKIRLARKLVVNPTAWLRTPQAYARARARVEQDRRAGLGRFRRERLAIEAKPGYRRHG